VRPVDVVNPRPVGGQIGLDAAAYERVHDNADATASAVNNGGVPDQVAFLVDAYGPAGAEDPIRRAAGDRQASGAS
jgi:hypothetical protein